MTTNTDDLNQQANKLSSISQEFQAAVQRVDSIAGELASQMQGAAGTAAQQSLSSFNQAANQQNQLLEQIGQTITTSGGHYETQSSDSASSISNVDMGM